MTQAVFLKGKMMKLKKLLAVSGLTAIIAGSLATAFENCLVVDYDTDKELIECSDPNDTEIDENMDIDETPAE